MTPDEKISRAVRRVVDARELMAVVNLLTAAAPDDEQADVIGTLIASLADPMRRRAVNVTAVRAMVLEVASW